MQKILRGTAILFLSTLVPLAAFSQTLASLLPGLSPAALAKLEATHELTVFGSNYESLKLWRDTPFASSVRDLYYSRKNATMAAEGLFLIPVGELGHGQAKEALLTRAMTAISTMKGLQVWSNSLKRYETFIYDASRVSTTSKEARLPDPAFTSYPVSTSFLIYEKEEQTGDGFSDYTFAERPSWYEVTQTNVTPLKYAGFITLVNPRDLLTAVYVIPLHHQILVYGITTAKTLDFFGWERAKNDSLYTRIKALVTWFTKNLNAPSS
ncbi:MAG: hypothetical protein HKM05_07750 [Spirochaetales bacterium]|nr:hypothetical protein [Spirochaetales bacterium]